MNQINTFAWAHDITKKSYEVIHLKTGNKYTVLLDNVIECTNGREEIRYVVYADHNSNTFCRERTEFFSKFKPL